MTSGQPDSEDPPPEMQRQSDFLYTAIYCILLPLNYQGFLEKTSQTYQYQADISKIVSFVMLLVTLTSTQILDVKTYPFTGSHTDVTGGFPLFGIQVHYVVSLSSL